MTSLVGRGKPQRLIRKAPEASPPRSRPDRRSPDAAGGWKRHLEFLGALGQLVVQSGHSLEQMLEGLVRILPAAWRYPEICCARAILRGHVFATPNYRESPWMLEGEICVQGVPVCKLQVAYLAACPEADNGPFTHEERALLSLVAALLSKTVERLEAIQRLRETVEQLNLERGAPPAGQCGPLRHPRPD